MTETGRPLGQLPTSYGTEAGPYCGRSVPARRGRDHLLRHLRSQVSRRRRDRADHCRRLARRGRGRPGQGRRARGGVRRASRRGVLRLGGGQGQRALEPDLRGRVLYRDVQHLPVPEPVPLRRRPEPGHQADSAAGQRKAAQPWPERSIQYMIDAGRPDLIPGADGSIRYAYRQMTGWRVDRALVVAAVARYAPGLPVVNGPDYPPAVTRAEAFAARRNRRATGF